MDLFQEIGKAENLYGQKLEIFFNNIYGKSNLYSHGLEHHRRVWHYSRELISYPEAAYTLHDSLFPLKLLIASYLHDSGMSVDPGPRHGHLSRIFCEQFLSDNGLAINDFSDVLRAIENHDNKDYQRDAAEPYLLAILSAADDMDALGYTGIYRYIEIYLTRGIPYNELGNLIKTNVKGRFGKLMREFGHLPLLMERERNRFEIILEFCQNYDYQLNGYNFATDNPSGFCGIAELINLIPLKSFSLDSVFEHAEKFSTDPVISSFFRNLKNELSA